MVCAVLAIGLVGAGCSSDSTDSAGTPVTTAATTTTAMVAAPVLSKLHVERGEFARVVDETGSQVLLRGVNVNSLGDYYQADRQLPPVVALTATDWDEMASIGLDSVRLIVSWSFLEPTRGTFDKTYVAKVKAAVAAAKAHGLYVILDMHQDAWGKYIATPAGTACPVGTEPNAGWDGAPEWATITDGASTCRQPGNRESAPAVKAAFNNFYDNRDGIRDEFVNTWAQLATVFAKEPAVAGYDLLNEPNVSDVGDVVSPKYTELMSRAIGTVRAAETMAGGFSHVVFAEPLVLFPLGGTVPTGALNDPNLAFAPHNYWESISDILTIEHGFAVDTSTAKPLGVPLWIGEYGWFDTGEASLAELRRYAVAEDAALASGAWWQWSQACGDPHFHSTTGAVADAVRVHLITAKCPGDSDPHVTTQFASVLGRAYPRRAPGHLVSLTSDPDTGLMRLTGRADGAQPGAELVVWIPARSGVAMPAVSGTAIGSPEVTKADGGWFVSTKVGCDYTLEVGGQSGDASTSLPRGDLAPCPAG